MHFMSSHLAIETHLSMVESMNSSDLGAEFSAAILGGMVDKFPALLGRAKELREVELSQLLVLLSRFGGAGWPTELVKFGARVDYRDDEGQTAISQCIHGMVDARDCLGERDTYQTAAELLSLGANPNGEYLGMSLILLSAMSKLPGFMGLLLVAGGSLDKVEPQSVTGDTTRSTLHKLRAGQALGNTEWLEIFIRK